MIKKTCFFFDLRNRKKIRTSAKNMLLPPKFHWIDILVILNFGENLVTFWQVSQLFVFFRSRFSRLGQTLKFKNKYLRCSTESEKNLKNPPLFTNFRKVYKKVSKILFNLLKMATETRKRSRLWGQMTNSLYCWSQHLRMNTDQYSNGRWSVWEEIWRLHL